MNKTGFFQSGRNKLFYSRVIPEHSRGTGILFIHAGNGNSLGPHRMFVELAEKYNILGYSTFRFDMTGCGDSEGNVSDIDSKSEISDVHQAVKYFMKLADLDDVILIGISRGSRISFELMQTHSFAVRGLILLSAPISSKKAATKYFSVQLREYTAKLTDLDALRRLLSGKADPAQVLKTLWNTLKFSKRHKPASNRKFASKCPVLLIYGQCDPIAEDSAEYYTNLCKLNGSPYEYHIIKRANHSFFHYKWKDEIFAITKKWLEKL